MDQQTLSKLCEQVYRRFPEVAGSRPKVQFRPDGQLLLLFNGSAKAADGRTIRHTIRVVATDKGTITKVTTTK